MPINPTMSIEEILSIFDSSMRSKRVTTLCLDNYFKEHDLNGTDEYARIFREFVTNVADDAYDNYISAMRIAKEAPEKYSDKTIPTPGITPVGFFSKVLIDRMKNPEEFHITDKEHSEGKAAYMATHIKELIDELSKYYYVDNTRTTIIIGGSEIHIYNPEVRDLLTLIFSANDVDFYCSDFLENYIYNNSIMNRKLLDDLTTVVIKEIIIGNSRLDLFYENFAPGSIEEEKTTKEMETKMKKKKK